MARSRNIKPAFFDNDELAELSPITRLFFIGLWTIADFKGDFEWREKRIKAKILPYDKCNLKEIAINLDKSGFIRFYSDGEKIYCNVVNFTIHQNPHKNEKQKGSDIPIFSSEMRQAVDFKELTINRDLSRQERNDSHTNPSDSLNLIPDSLNLIPESEDRKLMEVFQFWRDTMKKIQATTILTTKRARAIKARLKDYDVETIKTAIENCSKDPFSMGQNDRQTKYNDIELICRTGEKLESFLEEKTNENTKSTYETTTDRYNRQAKQLRERQLQANPEAYTEDGILIQNNG